MFFTPTHFQRGTRGSQQHLPQLRCTMGSLTSGHWPLIMAHMLLLQLGPVQVQGVDPLSQKIRRLNEQFLQFQALTQARLNMLALNQNTNSSWGLEIRVQALNDHYYSMSQDLEHLKQSTAQEIEGLREWCRQLEKKSKRIEGRVVLMERNLRENRHHAEKENLGQNISDLRQEFQSQEERLAALQDQRDELLVGLRALQESLKIQALRVTRVEGRLGDVLHLSGGGNRGPLDSGVAPQNDYEPRRRGQPHSGERPGRNLYGHSSPELPVRPRQDHATNQPKHLKAKRLRPQPDSHLLIQEQYPDPKSLSTDYLPHPDSYHPSSQIRVQANTRPYPIKQEQLQPHQSVSHRHVHIHPQVQQPPQSHNLNDSSEPRATSKVLPRPELSQDRQSRTRLGAPALQESDVLSQPRSDPYQPRATERKGEEEEETGTEVDTSVIYSFLQLPLRHKIPKRPVPKKHPTICNVDSMLFFPTASAENYVTFSVTLPHLPELSLCLWLRVEASHVGTLFSYAMDDNDNQLVLYGRNSSASSPSLSAPSSSARSSLSSSSFSPSSYHSASAPSLDFVIGDTVFRRLPMSSLLDARWHHLCILWSSIQGRFWHYSDRRLSSSGANFRKGWEIPGGGSAVLGQEQDSVGGGFDPAEGFAGQMAGFRMWNRVLSPLEVEGVAEGRGVPRGVVLGMEDIKEVHGEVQQVACECLEHCV